MKKTNAARLLDTLGIHYELREYEVDESDLGAKGAAEKVGLPLNQIFKTLVVRGDKTGVLMVCIPGDAELDLKELAQASGNKRVELVPLKEVQPLTGYLRGGCSPLAAKKRYPVFIDESALNFPFISISAGMRGLQILIAPEDLKRATEATLGAFASR